MYLRDWILDGIFRGVPSFVLIFDSKTCSFKGTSPDRPGVGAIIFIKKPFFRIVTRPWTFGAVHQSVGIRVEKIYRRKKIDQSILNNFIRVY